MRKMLRKPMDKKAALSAVIMAGVLGATLLSVGCTTAGAPSADPAAAAEEQSIVQAKEAEEWGAYLPKQVTKEDGTVVQKTPYGGTPASYFGPADFKVYNNYVLDSDKRGCLSCHDLGDALTANLATIAITGPTKTSRRVSTIASPAMWPSRAAVWKTTCTLT